jgi:hypothetical protein
MKKQMEENIRQMMSILVTKMCEVNKEPTPDPEGAEFYKTLADTFNAFDKDGNAELQFPEYKEAWKFLNQPGNDSDIKNAFDSVDVDASGLVDRDEFIFYIMGKKGFKFGLLADM